MVCVSSDVSLTSVWGSRANSGVKCQDQSLTSAPPDPDPPEEASNESCHSQKSHQALCRHRAPILALSTVTETHPPNLSALFLFFVCLFLHILKASGSKIPKPWAPRSASIPRECMAATDERVWYVCVSGVLGWRSQCIGGVGGTGRGGGDTLKSLWQQGAGLEPVDLFESAVKHRAGGYTAQRTKKKEKRASEHGKRCA